MRRYVNFYIVNPIFDAVFKTARYWRNFEEYLKISKEHFEKKLQKNIHKYLVKCFWYFRRIKGYFEEDWERIKEWPNESNQIIWLLRRHFDWENVEIILEIFKEILIRIRKKWKVVSEKFWTTESFKNSKNVSRRIWKIRPRQVEILTTFWSNLTLKCILSQMWNLH